MITCRNFDPHSPHQAVALSEMSRSGWVHLEAPSPEECAQVQEAFGLPPTYLTAALDHHERPRLEHEDETLLVLLRSTVNTDKSLSKPLSTCPVAFILRGNLLVTVCLADNLGDGLLKSIPANQANQGSRTAVMLMLALFMRTCREYHDHLQILGNFVNDIDKYLQESMHNTELFKLLRADQSLIYYLMALKGNQTVLEKLRAGATRRATEEEKELLEDVLIENRQAIDMTEIYTEIIGSLGDTIGSVVSNNLNKVMKILTGLTIVFMVPNIISSLYGMNVPLPGEGNPYAYMVLGLLCLVSTLVVYLLLKKKNWM